MKKALSLLLVIVMVICMIPMSALADDTESQLTISFETDFTTDLEIGDTFTVTGILTNNEIFGAMCLSLVWNENAVNFNGFQMNGRVMDSEVFNSSSGYTAPIVNHTEGIITAVDTMGYDLNGKIFVANFEIVGAGELGIGLKTDSGADFYISNLEGTANVPATIDYSALENLSVAAPEPVGPAIPDGAPFTAITTDAGAAIAIEQQENVSFNYADVPYYIVTIPADATTAYVTAPDQVVMEDYNTGELQATGYAADVANGWNPLYISYDYEDTADGPKVEIPMNMVTTDWSGEVELCFVEDEDGNLSHAFGIEDSNYACLGLISFRYGTSSAPVEPEEPTVSEIPAGAAFVDMIARVNGEDKPVTIQVMDDHYKVLVPLGTTAVYVVYDEGVPYVDNFGYAAVRITGVDGVSDDGYSQSTSDGKTTVGLLMKKAPANGAPTTIELISLDYANRTAVGIKKADNSAEDWFSFTYQLSEGEHYAILPEGIGYTASGSPVAKNGYTFSVTIDEGYEATADFAVKVNGTTVATEPGEITVDSVTQDLFITVAGVQKIVEATDISVTFDLTDYTGAFSGYLSYIDTDYTNVETTVEVGKKNTLTLEASKNMIFQAQASGVSALVTGWKVNDTVYDIPTEYTTITLADNVTLNLNTDGYFSLNIGTTNPFTAVIKPIVATAESLGAAPDFTEDCVKVNDISVVGADVVSAEWNGDVLNVILAEDTALDATFKTMWNVYAKNTNDPAIQNCVMFNGKQEGVFVAETGGEGTFDISTSVTLANGVAAGEYKFEPNPNAPNLQYVLFTPKTFTVNFYVSGKEPAPEPEQPTSNPITKIDLSHPNLVTDETNGAMSMAMVTGASEQIDVSTVLENAELDATQVVVWSSSVPEVASVENGKVTALQAGTTVITAKAVDPSSIALLADGEEVLAQFTLTVADPTDGYTVTMGEDVEAVVNNTVSVPVTIGHTGDVTKYNAFDLTFEYDPTVLELTSTKIDGMTVTVKDGKIHVERYGTDLTVGSTALTLTFKAIATGETNVKVTSAKVDISESALTQDAPDASVIDNITLVAVTGFTVNLPAEFTGESSVLPGENYTFEAKDKNYNYTFDGSTMDGQPVNIKDNGDGTFTIENVTGNIVIQTVPTGKTFSVTLGEDMTGETSAKYMTSYTATLTKDDSFTYNIKVTIGGKNYTGFTYDASTGLITIPGEAITGEIVFNSNKTAKTPDKHSVEFTGEYGDIAEGTLMEVENGKDYILTINKVVGYKYTVTATMGGETVEVKDNGDGTYTIKNVTGDLVITIAKEYDLAVEVKEYVTLNDQSMFLVTATATVDEGKVLSYNGTAMFYSNQYNAWSFLVITEGTLSVDDAKALITLNEGTKVELSQTYNVNETANNTVDINDAQLVFDMYNNEYQDIDTVGMQKFLKADVNGDKKIDVNDAAAVVAEIVKNK